MVRIIFVPGNVLPLDLSGNRYPGCRRRIVIAGIGYSFNDSRDGPDAGSNPDTDRDLLPDPGHRGTPTRDVRDVSAGKIHVLVFRLVFLLFLIVFFVSVLFIMEIVPLLRCLIAVCLGPAHRIFDFFRSPAFAVILRQAVKLVLPVWCFRRCSLAVSKLYWF